MTDQLAADRSGRTTQDGLLNIQVGQRPDGWLIELRGELDMASAGTLEAELQRLDGDKPIALDLTELDFMDSAGLSLLLRTAAAGMHFEHVNRGSGQPARLLDLSGVDKQLLPQREAGLLD